MLRLNGGTQEFDAKCVNILRFELWLSQGHSIATDIGLPQGYNYATRAKVFGVEGDVVVTTDGRIEFSLLENILVTPR